MPSPLSASRLKAIASYRLQKNLDADNLFIVEGVRLCAEALASGFHVHTICALPDWLAANAAHIPANATVYEITPEQLDRLSLQRTPNKVWMLLERRKPQTIVDNSQLVLALDRLQDPGNFGTILRTADWFGIRNVVCSPDTVSCYNPKVVQATMGAIFRTNISYCNLPEWLSGAKKQGFHIYGALLDGDNLYHADIKKPAMLIIGNEGRGISPEVAAIVQHKLTIPNLGGTCESLNAATATAIIISELTK